MTTPHLSSRWDRAALGIAGAFLLLFLAGGLAFLLGLERASLGSWRNVAAVYLGIVTAGALLLALALPLARRGWLRTAPPHTAREYATRVALVLASGALGGVVAARVRGGAAPAGNAGLEGAVHGVSLLVVLWLFGRLFRRPVRRSATP
ncbi:MAG TPA: hypothetical protein VGD56_08315 [Gemmatirosa sp.]